MSVSPRILPAAGNTAGITAGPVVSAFATAFPYGTTYIAVQWRRVVCLGKQHGDRHAVAWGLVLRWGPR